MAILNHEGLAALRLMVCMSKADGALQPDEEEALADTLSGLTLPEGLTLESLLEEKHAPAALAAQITTREGRDSAYASVLAVACCDRQVSASEEQLLASLRQAWGIQKDEEQALLKTLQPVVAPAPASGILPAPVADEAQRRAAFEKLLARYSLLTALTEAIPVPYVPDILVIPMQVQLVRAVAALFGKEAGRQTIQLLFETLGVGVGVRVGLSSLAKFVPIWGSLFGAASSFAATYAFGKVAYKYFSSDDATLEELKPLFREEQARGKLEFDQAHGAELKQLAYDLQQGKISQAEFERQVDALEA